MKAGHSIQRTAGMAIGPKHMLVKLVIAIVIGAAFFVTFFKPMYHVSARPFQLVPIGKQRCRFRSMAPSTKSKTNPRTGKVYQGRRRGDGRRSAGAFEDGSTARPIAERPASRRPSAARGRRGTQSGPHAARQVAADAEAQEDEKAAQAEAELPQKQIDEAEMKADFDGVIIRADDTESKHNLAVKKGDVLLEIAIRQGSCAASWPSRERDIQEILREHSTRASWPPAASRAENLGFPSTGSSPAAMPRKGTNVSRSMPTSTSNPTGWRPGMAGEARIDVENRRLVWIWTHRLIDFLKLKLWM